MLVPARSDAEHEAPARQVPERLDLAGQRDRMVVGEDQQAGGEPDPRVVTLAAWARQSSGDIHTVP